MTSLKIKNFKAFREEFNYLENEKLNLENKNFLLYGDNGSGKSSIYEAIKIIFFKDKLESLIPQKNTPEEQIEANHTFWDQYKNSNSISSFEIEVNDVNFNSFITIDYQVFMIALDKFCLETKIRFDLLLEKFDLDIDNISEFCESNFLEIQNVVNEKLKEFKEENINIVIDNEDDYSIKITDTIRNLESKDKIQEFFNEAKLNLIILLLLFESIKRAQIESKKKILVLDDFITSLDVSNRTFLMKYILENFFDSSENPKSQILIFTHNVYFYNLIMYLINDIYKIKEKWKFGNIYEIESQHKLYIKGKIDKVSEIRSFYLQNSQDILNTGNKIRQKFEILLYEFSKLLMIGTVEDSKKIIDRIENSKSVYFKNKETASDLIDKLETILNEGNESNLSSRLNSKIIEFKSSEYNNFKKIIRDLKLYQKVTLHPMSHGTIGQNSFTTDEIEESLDLLEKFEKYLKELVDSDIDGA